MGPRVSDVRGFQEMDRDVTAAGTLARKGREDLEGRKRKFSLLSTSGIAAEFETKIVRHQHFTILM